MACRAAASFFKPNILRANYTRTGSRFATILIFFTIKSKLRCQWKPNEIPLTQNKFLNSNFTADRIDLLSNLALTIASGFASPYVKLSPKSWEIRGVECSLKSPSDTRVPLYANGHAKLQLVPRSQKLYFIFIASRTLCRLRCWPLLCVGCTLCMLSWYRTSWIPTRILLLAF